MAPVLSNAEKSSAGLTLKTIFLVVDDNQQLINNKIDKLICYSDNKLSNNFKHQY